MKCRYCEKEIERIKGQPMWTVSRIKSTSKYTVYTVTCLGRDAPSIFHEPITEFENVTNILKYYDTTGQS